MKASLRALGALLLVLSLTGCLEDGVKAPEPKVEQSYFPVSRTITNSDNKPLDVVIVGRSGSHVRFYRSEDASMREYDYEIAQLSIDDQHFLSRLPISRLSPLKTEEEIRAENILATQIKNLQTEYDRQKQRVEEVREKLGESNLTASEKSMHKGILDRETKRLTEIETRLKEKQG